MLCSIRSKFIAARLGVTFLVGEVSLVVGSELLERAVLSEAKNRVHLDLNAAREIFLGKGEVFVYFADKTGQAGAVNGGHEIADIISAINGVGFPRGFIGILWGVVG